MKSEKRYRVAKSAWIISTDPKPSSDACSFSTCWLECQLVNCSSFTLTFGADNGGVCAFGAKGQTLAVEPYDGLVETVEIWTTVTQLRGIVL